MRGIRGAGKWTGHRERRVPGSVALQVQQVRCYSVQYILRILSKQIRRYPCVENDCVSRLFCRRRHAPRWNVFVAQ